MEILKSPKVVEKSNLGTAPVVLERGDIARPLLGETLGPKVLGETFGFKVLGETLGPKVFGETLGPKVLGAIFGTRVLGETAQKAVSMSQVVATSKQERQDRERLLLLLPARRK